MLDNLNLIFLVPENHTKPEPDMPREQMAKPHPADEISLRTDCWQKDLASYFLMQFGTF
jgi:hypothetical protein